MNVLPALRTSFPPCRAHAYTGSEQLDREHLHAERICIDKQSLTFDSTASRPTLCSCASLGDLQKRPDRHWLARLATCVCHMGHRELEDTCTHMLEIVSLDAKSVKWNKNTSSIPCES